MKHFSKSVADSNVERGKAVQSGNPKSLSSLKVAAKRASASSKVKDHKGSSPYGFIPPDARIRVSRWPEL